MHLCYTLVKIKTNSLIENGNRKRKLKSKKLKTKKQKDKINFLLWLKLYLITLMYDVVSLRRAH